MSKKNRFHKCIFVEVADLLCLYVFAPQANLRCQLHHDSTDWSSDTVPRRLLWNDQCNSSFGDTGSVCPDDSSEAIHRCQYVVEAVSRCTDAALYNMMR